MTPEIRLGTLTDYLDLTDPQAHLLLTIDAPTPAEGATVRAVGGPIQVGGATADALWANKSAIEAMLVAARKAHVQRRPPAERVSLQVRAGTTDWTYIDVIGGTLDVTEHLPTGLFASGTLTLACRPLFRGAALSAENLLTAPTDPTDAAWTATNVTATADDATAPDGSTTAGTLLETTANAGHSIAQDITKAAEAQTLTASAYVKPNGRTVVHLSLTSGANGATAGFTLSGAGSVSTAAALVSTGWADPSAAITAEADGWYRVSLTATSDADASATVTLALSDGSTTTYAGNTSLGVRVWGVQLEEAASAGLLLVPQYHADTIIPEYIIPAYTIPEVPATGMDADPDNLIGSATWTVNNMTLTTGQSDPTGGTGATRSIENTGTSLHYTESASFNAASAGTYTAAVYLKKYATGPSTVYLQASIANNRGYALPFNLDTGAFGTAIATSTLTGYADPTGNGTAVRVSADWWFVKWTTTLPADTGHEIRVHTTSNIESTYAGNTANGVYLFRPQAVAGSTIDTPTAYVPASTVPDETVPEELIASGKQSGAYVYGIPGDAPALCRVELSDASTDVVVNRVHLGAWSGPDVALGEVTPLLALTDGSEASFISDGGLYAGSGYAQLGADGTWTVAGQATVDAVGPQRGSVDVWARVRDHSSYISPPTAVPNGIVVTGGIYARRLARVEEIRDSTVQSISIPKPNNSPGATLVLALQYMATTVFGVPTASVTATGGETWTEFAPTGSDSMRLRSWYCEDAAALTGPLTITFSSDARFVTVTLIEIVGAAAASYDTSAVDTYQRVDGAEGTTITVGPVTPAQVHSLLLSWAVSTNVLRKTVQSPGDWESWHLVSSLGSGTMAFLTVSDDPPVSNSITWQAMAHLGPGGTFIPPTPGYWAGVIASFKAASATVSNITRADWSVVVTALDADGNESLPLAGETVSVPSETSAVSVSWGPPLVGTAASYRVYRNRGTGWAYDTVTAPTTTYLFTDELSLTTADPPTTTPPVAAFRAAVALPSGTTLWRSQSSVPSQHANATWEWLYLGQMPWPPVAQGEGETPDGAYLAVEASHLTGAPVDVDVVCLLDAGSGQVIAWREGMDAETTAEWVIDTNRDGVTSGWLRDATTGDDAGQLALVPGRLALNPGNARLVMRSEVAGGESNIVDADLRISRVLVTPRWQYIRGTT